MQTGAQLHRVAKLDDRFNAQVFAFILPKSLTSGLGKDLTTRDFLCGYQKWVVSFVRTADTHIGAYLILKNVTEGMKVIADFSITFVNRQHFTRNDSFMEKNCEFTREKHTHGRKNCIGLCDLEKRDFAQETGEYIVEIEIRNVRTSIDFIIQLPKEKKDNLKQHEFPKYETQYFTFGGFEWHIAIYPNGENRDNRKPFLCLSKLTNFDHFCKVKYRVQVGSKERNMLDSGILSHLFDTDGGGDVFDLKTNVFNLVSTKGRLNIRLEMHTIAVISFLEIPVTSRNKTKPTSAHCYDRDKQAWMLETDTKSQYLKLKLYYTDISQVPRDYARYVCWNASVIPAYGNTGEIKANSSPFAYCYIQKDNDTGYEMTTNIPVKKLTEPENIYVFEDNQSITVQLEWIDSYLLLHANIHPTDNLVRVQRQQMSREILALQSENYALEKQLHSYQQSIAKSSAKGSLADDPFQSPRIANKTQARATAQQHSYSDEQFYQDTYYKETHSNSGKSSRKDLTNKDPYHQQSQSYSTSSSQQPQLSGQTALQSQQHQVQPAPSSRQSRSSSQYSVGDGYQGKSTDKYAQDKYAYDKYPQDKYPQTDPYAQDSYAQDKYMQDPYAAQDKYGHDKYAAHTDKYPQDKHGDKHQYTQDKYSQGYTQDKYVQDASYYDKYPQDKYHHQDKYATVDKPYRDTYQDVTRQTNSRSSSRSRSSQKYYEQDLLDD